MTTNEEMTQDAELGWSPTNEGERGVFFKFFQPWSSLLAGQLGRLVKAVLMGLLAVFILFALVLSLFSSFEELDQRSVVSVLVNPSHKVVEGQRDKWMQTGSCYSDSDVKPIQEKLPLYGESKVCMSWRPVEYWGPPWMAVEYMYSPGSDSYEVGLSRSDALDYVFGRWIGLGFLLGKSIGVLLSLQFGVFIGYSYLRRASERDVSESAKAG
jgi:hypothetical protein